MSRLIFRSAVLPVLLFMAAGGSGPLPVNRAFAQGDAPEESSAGAATNVDSDTSPGDAPGQKSRPARGLVIEEIVVTSERREQAVTEVPVAISAFRGEDLEALGIVDTRDLQSVVPGFTAGDNGYNTPVYTLRGVGYNETTYTATSTVGVYIDEVAMPYAVMTKGANLDLERVEVLKGPQGTLYGRNTTGGAINYIAKKPTHELSYGLTTSYANYSTREFQGYVSGALTDTLLGRIAAKRVRSSEGWQYSNTRPDDELGKQRKDSVRGILDWDVSDNWSFRFMASGWSDESDSQAPQAIEIRATNPLIPDNPAFVDALAASNPLLATFVQQNVGLSPPVRNYPVIDPDSEEIRVADWTPGGPGPGATGDGRFAYRLNDEFWQVSGTVSGRLTDNLNLTSIAYVERVESDETVLENSGLNVNNAEQVIDAHVRAYSLEIRLDGAVGDSLRWLAGVNASDDEGFESHNVFVPTGSTVFPDPVTGTSSITTHFVTEGTVDVREYGVFGKADWSFNANWSASLGLRYSEGERGFVGCLYEPEDAPGTGVHGLFAVLAAVNFQTVNDVQKGDCLALNEEGQSEAYVDELNENSLSGRAALTWTPNEDDLYYASFSRGFKAGGFPVINASFQDQYNPTEQEELLAWELGAKIKLAPQLRSNLAVFHYDYRDKQLLSFFNDPTFGVLTILENIPESRVVGAEIDFQYSPFAGFFLAGAGAYIDAEIEDFVGTNSNGETQDFSGNRFNFTPRVQYSLVADYAFPIGDELEGGIGLDYAYISESNSTIENTDIFNMPANGKVGLRLRLSTARWALTAWGKNITNEFSASGVYRVLDAVTRTTGMPRTYGLTLSFNNL